MTKEEYQKYKVKFAKLYDSKLFIINQALELNSIGIEELNIPIYRYMTAKNLLNDIKNESYTLRQMSTWADKWDMAFFKTSLLHKLPNGKVRPISTNPAFDKYYGQCWTTKPESEAMWFIKKHSNPEEKNRQVLKIKVNLKDFFEKIFKTNDDRKSLAGCFIGKVHYVPEENITTEIQQLYSKILQSLLDPSDIPLHSFKKRPQFEYEKEIRLLYYKEPATGGSLELNIGTFDFIQEIMFHPEINDADFEFFKDKFIELGIGCEIVKSKLLDPPPTQLI